jgi:hypothetical protein
MPSRLRDRHFEKPNPPPAGTPMPGFPDFPRGRKGRLLSMAKFGATPKWGFRKLGFGLHCVHKNRVCSGSVAAPCQLLKLEQDQSRDHKKYISGGLSYRKVFHRYLRSVPPVGKQPIRIGWRRKEPKNRAEHSTQGEYHRFPKRAWSSRAPGANPPPPSSTGIRIAIEKDFHPEPAL